MWNGRTNDNIFRKKGLLRVIAFITLWSFLFSIGGGEILIENAWATKTPLELTAVSSKGVGSPVSFKELDVNTFTIPKKLGHIRDVFKGSSDKTVVHIQDAHCNYAAQHKINDVIGYLSKEYGVNTVNLEGGKGDYDLSLFTSIYDKDIRERVADYFVEEGLINGAEYFAINNPDKADLWGVEDTELYIGNLNVYRESLKHKREIEEYLKELNHIISNLKRHMYNAELVEFDQKYTDYKAEKLEFKDYLAYLIQKANQNAINIKSFTSIHLLSQLLKQEAGIDSKTVNIERNNLMGEFKKMLSRNALKELAEKTIEFDMKQISQKDYYNYLVKKANQMNFDMNKYPEIQKYIIYMATYETIDKIKAMKELASFEAGIKENIFENDDQTTLDALSKDLILTKNIFDISISIEDYEYYKTNKELFNMQNYENFIIKNAPLYKVDAKLSKNIKNLDAYRNNMAKFYEYSFKRDKAFLNNLKPSKESLLITGGFHTENLCDLLKKNGISYVSIMLNFKNGKGYESPYFNRLSGKECTPLLRIRSMLSADTLAIASFLNTDPTLCKITNGKRAKLELTLLAKWREAVESGSCDGVKLVYGDHEVTIDSNGGTLAKNPSVVNVASLMPTPLTHEEQDEVLPGEDPLPPVLANAELGAQVAHMKNFDRLVRILHRLKGEKVFSDGEVIEFIPENAHDREIITFIIKVLGNHVRETRDAFGNRVFIINKSMKNRRIGQIIQKWVISPEGGAKAINFEGEDGAWCIVAFESDLNDPNVLEHEQIEIKYRKQGLNWKEAHKKAIMEQLLNVGHHLPARVGVPVDTIIDNSEFDPPIKLRNIPLKIKAWANQVAQRFMGKGLFNIPQETRNERIKRMIKILNERVNEKGIRVLHVRGEIWVFHESAVKEFLNLDEHADKFNLALPGHPMPRFRKDAELFMFFVINRVNGIRHPFIKVVEDAENELIDDFLSRIGKRIPFGELVDEPGIDGAVANAGDLQNVANIMRQHGMNIPDHAADREVVEFIINDLREHDEIDETVDVFGNRVLKINIRDPNRQGLARIIKNWVIVPTQGPQAINFRGKDGAWIILGFASDLNKPHALEHEQLEVAFRRKGLRWEIAHEEAMLEQLANLGPGRAIAGIPFNDIRGFNEFKDVWAAIGDGRGVLMARVLLQPLMMALGLVRLQWLIPKMLGKFWPKSIHGLPKIINDDMKRLQKIERILNKKMKGRGIKFRHIGGMRRTLQATDRFKDIEFIAFHEKALNNFFNRHTDLFSIWVKKQNRMGRPISALFLNAVVNMLRNGPRIMGPTKFVRAENDLVNFFINEECGGRGPQLAQPADTPGQNAELGAAVGGIAGDHFAEESTAASSFWHGGSVSFDGFDEGFIGTGVGKQQEGWGFSLASELNARAYASLIDVKSAPGEEPIVITVKFNGQETTSFDTTSLDLRLRQYYANQMAEHITGAGHTVEEARAIVVEGLHENVKQIESEESRLQTEKLIAFFNDVDISVSYPRFLYQISVGKNSIWLDLHKPLNAITWKMIESHAASEGVKFDEHFSVVDKMPQIDGRPLKGGHIYDALIKVLGSDKEASLFLDRAGFTGNVSKGFYLAFPSRLKILRRIDMNAQEDKSLDSASDESGGGSWFAARIYRLYVAWWFESPVSIAIAGGLLHFIAPNASAFLTSFVATTLFIGLHFLRGRKVMFSPEVIGLGAGTGVAAYTFLALGLSNPWTMAIFAALTAIHLGINIISELISPKTITQPDSDAPKKETPKSVIVYGTLDQNIQELLRLWDEVRDFTEWQDIKGMSSAIDKCTKSIEARIKKNPELMEVFLRKISMPSDEILRSLHSSPPGNPVQGFVVDLDESPSDTAWNIWEFLKENHPLVEYHFGVYHIPSIGKNIIVVTCGEEESATQPTAFEHDLIDMIYDGTPIQQVDIHSHPFLGGMFPSPLDYSSRLSDTKTSVASRILLALELDESESRCKPVLRRIDISTPSIYSGRPASGEDFILQLAHVFTDMNVSEEYDKPAELSELSEYARSYLNARITIAHTSMPAIEIPGGQQTHEEILPASQPYIGGPVLGHFLALKERGINAAEDVARKAGISLEELAEIVFTAQQQAGLIDVEGQHTRKVEAALMKRLPGITEEEARILAVAGEGGLAPMGEDRGFAIIPQEVLIQHLDELDTRDDKSALRRSLKLIAASINNDPSILQQRHRLTDDQILGALQRIGEYTDEKARRIIQIAKREAEYKDIRTQLNALSQQISSTEQRADGEVGGRMPEDPIRILTPSSHYFEMGSWRRVKHLPLQEGHNQGWKVHVAATPKDVVDILRLVLPILIKHAVPHKVIDGVRLLKLLNKGNHPTEGDTQVGKFIAIYTKDKPQADKLVEEIDLALRNEGFEIPDKLIWNPEDSKSDKLVKGGISGLVGCRHGSFNDGYVVLPDGEIVGDARDRYKHPAIWETLKTIPPAQTVEEEIKEKIDQSGGRITFEEYMRICLYSDDGYYSVRPGISDRLKGDVDFITFTETLGPHFGKAMAEELFEMWKKLGEPDEFSVVEMGGGNGTLARNTMLEIGARAMENPEYRRFFDALKYVIVDSSPTLTVSQKRIFSEETQLNPAEKKRYASKLRIIEKSAIDSLPKIENGAFISNELVDAFPVHKIRFKGGKFQEAYVAYDETAWKFYEKWDKIAADREEKILDYLKKMLQTEDIEKVKRLMSRHEKEVPVNLHMLDWIENVAKNLQRGYVVTFDYTYGYGHDGNAKLWLEADPKLTEPAIRAYKNGKIISPFRFPGRSDMTANASFQVQMQKSIEVGLANDYLMSQDKFMLAHGIDQEKLLVKGPRQIGAPREDVSSSFYVLVQSKGLLDEPVAALVKSTNVDIGEIESRQAQTVEALIAASRNADTVKVVVGIPKGMSKTKVAQTLTAINRGLARNGFGDVEDKDQVITFEIDAANPDQTRKNYERAVDRAIGDGLPKNGRIVLFAPEMDNVEMQLAKQAQSTYEGQDYVSVIPDAYTDARPEKNEYPDIDVRVALARHVAFYYNGNDSSSALTAITGLLRQVVVNPEELEDIVKEKNDMLIFGLLRIQPIIWKDMNHWKRIQKATVTAL